MQDNAWPAKLPTEILELIFDQIAADIRNVQPAQDLINVQLTCRRFRAIAARLMWRYVNILVDHRDCNTFNIPFDLRDKDAFRVRLTLNGQGFVMSLKVLSAVADHFRKVTLDALYYDSQTELLDLMRLTMRCAVEITLIFHSRYSAYIKTIVLKALKDLSAIGPEKKLTFTLDCLTGRYTWESKHVDQIISLLEEVDYPTTS
ncbi:hypothetical protein TRVA0_019S01904 [Trichomonascus vanleenenianus]|uniref:F-box protein n=1 Tax=Trichomonascus vanleenenianus TaxID=2268995 RepID=UPI003EC9E0F6